MHRYKTLSRIFLILSIINFALATPVVVQRGRGAPETNVNVMYEAEDGTTASQKRWDSEPRDYSLANAADRTSVPTTPAPLPDLKHSGLYSLSSVMSTGLHRRVEGEQSSNMGHSWPNQLEAENSHSVDSTFSWPNQLEGENPHSVGSTFSWPDHLEAENSHPVDPTFSWPDHLEAENSHPVDPTFSWPDHLVAANSLPPGPDHSPATGPEQLAAAHHQPNSGPSSPTGPETKGFSSQIGTSDPSRGPPSPAVPETKDLLGQLDLPRVPPSPTNSRPEAISQMSSHSGDEAINFLSHFWKGRIKRRISRSGAMDSAQESQATTDRTDP